MTARYTEHFYEYLMEKAWLLVYLMMLDAITLYSSYISLQEQLMVPTILLLLRVTLMPSQLHYCISSCYLESSATGMKTCVTYLDRWLKKGWVIIMHVLQDALLNQQNRCYNMVVWNADQVHVTVCGENGKLRVDISSQKWEYVLRFFLNYCIM